MQALVDAPHMTHVPCGPQLLHTHTCTVRRHLVMGVRTRHTSSEYNLLELITASFPGTLHEHAGAYYARRPALCGPLTATHTQHQS